MSFARQPYAGSGPRPTRRHARAAKKALPLIAGAPAVVKGGLTGFLILVFGELITFPIRGSGLILYWVALIAYAVAGNRAAAASVQSAPRAARDGALAAAFAFCLTLPLRLAAHSSSLSLLYVAVQIPTALVVGGLAAMIAARARRRLQSTPQEP